MYCCVLLAALPIISYAVVNKMAVAAHAAAAVSEFDELYPRYRYAQMRMHDAW